MDLHNDIFDDITLPDGIDKEICIDTIIARNCTYDIMDHDYPLCKSMITLFFKNHYYQFDRFKKALDTEYDLIQNYDRTREYKRNVDKNEHTTDSGSDINSVSAYNQIALAENTRVDSDAQGTRDNTENEDIYEHEYGDLSVMSTTEKVKQELELRMKQKYNIYIFIADLFFTELCLRNA